jgi:hypothetical protein
VNRALDIEERHHAAEHLVVPLVGSMLSTLPEDSNQLETPRNTDRGNSIGQLELREGTDGFKAAHPRQLRSIAVSQDDTPLKRATGCATRRATCCGMNHELRHGLTMLADYARSVPMHE